MLAGLVGLLLLSSTPRQFPAVDVARLAAGSDFAGIGEVSRVVSEHRSDGGLLLQVLELKTVWAANWGSIKPGASLTLRHTYLDGRGTTHVDKFPLKTGAQYLVFLRAIDTFPPTSRSEPTVYSVSGSGLPLYEVANGQLVRLGTTSSLDGLATEAAKDLLTNGVAAHRLDEFERHERGKGARARSGVMTPSRVRSFPASVRPLVPISILDKESPAWVVAYDDRWERGLHPMHWGYELDLSFDVFEKALAKHFSRRSTERQPFQDARQAYFERVVGRTYQSVDIRVGPHNSKLHVTIVERPVLTGATPQWPDRSASPLPEVRDIPKPELSLIKKLKFVGVRMPYDNHSRTRVVELAYLVHKPQKEAVEALMAELGPQWRTYTYSFGGVDISRKDRIATGWDGYLVTDTGLQDGQGGRSSIVRAYWMERLPATPIPPSQRPFR